MTAKKTKKSIVNKTPRRAARDLMAVMALSIVLGVGIGYVWGYSMRTSDSQEARDTAVTSMDSHAMSGFEVSAQNAPRVQVIVDEDKKSGYNVRVLTDNFIFTPENVNTSNIAGEGHAHLYIDNEKVARLYSPYYHYNGTFEGTKTFRVTLNANDHSEYTVNGVVIEDSISVTHDSSDPSHDEDHE
jgi:hypothetical protein